jgi:hypothetical protein
MTRHGLRVRGVARYSLDEPVRGTRPAPGEQSNAVPLLNEILCNNCADRSGADNQIGPHGSSFYVRALLS